MVKLPDNKSRAPSLSYPGQKPNDPNYARGMAKAYAETASAVADLSDHVLQDQVKRRDELEALELENKTNEGLNQIKASLENDTNYETHVPQFKTMSTALQGQLLQGISNPRKKEAYQKRLKGKFIAEEEKVRVDAEKGLDDRHYATTLETLNAGLKDIGTESFPVDQIPQRIAEMKENLDAMRRRGSISAAKHVKATEDLINEAAKTYFQRRALNSPAEAVAELQEYIKARSKGQIYRGDPRNGTPAPSDMRERVSPEDYLRSKGVTDISKMPLGMRASNNPGNIKYSGSEWQRNNFPGLIGPSKARDQGDPQAYFANPLAGMVAASHLALLKNQKQGMKSVQDIITNERGWTPGFQGAAKNIASTMGVPVNKPIDLSDPATMQSFLRALIKQEHGSAGKYYDDDLIAAAVSYTHGGKVEPSWTPTVLDTKGEVADIDTSQRLGTLEAVYGGLSDVELNNLVSKGQRKAAAKNQQQSIQDKNTLKGALSKMKTDGDLTAEDLALVQEACGRVGEAACAKFNAEMATTKLYRKDLKVSMRDGSTLQVSEMDQDQLEAYRETILKRNSKLKVNERAYADGAYKMLDAEIKRIEKEREEDPAKAADLQFQAVADIRENMDEEIAMQRAEAEDRAINDPENEARYIEGERARRFLFEQQLIEARQAAQEKMGLAEDDIRLVTKLEAKEYFPDLDDAAVADGNKKSLRDDFTAAFEKAYDKYGDKDIAARVVKDAYLLHVKEKTARDKAKVVADLIEEHYIKDTNPKAYTPKDLYRWGLVIDGAGQYNPEAASRPQTQSAHMPESYAERIRQNPGDRNIMRVAVDQYGAQAYVNALMNIPAPEKTPEPPKSAPPSGMDKDEYDFYSKWPTGKSATSSGER